MSTLLQDTREALGGDDLPHCTSRSLRLTRYARPDLNEKTSPTRKEYLARVVSKDTQRFEPALDLWHKWINGIPQPAEIIHGRLQSRLLINLGGTVLENAGLQIDRFGTAYIPGSAVKACARRAALVALRQWCETASKPESASCDLLAPACEVFDSQAEFLITFLRIFGFTELEWGGYDSSQGAREKNDLAWACGVDLGVTQSLWPMLRDEAKTWFATSTPNCDKRDQVRRGAIAFLPAFPLKRPAADLELDVLTTHHQEYYSEKRQVATDTENPIPVFFPAVSAGAVYTFALLPLAGGDETLLKHARSWLLTGLTTLGIGAKTSAGYGYFNDCTAEIRSELEKLATSEKERLEAEASKARQAAERTAREERKKYLSSLPASDQEDARLAEIADNRGRLKQYLLEFKSHSAEKQVAILRWLCSGGKELWLNEIKGSDIKKKKPWNKIIGDINRAKNQLKIDLP